MKREAWVEQALTERLTLASALDKHLKAQRALDSAGGDLVDEAIRLTTGWETAGLLAGAEANLRRRPRWFLEYQYFLIASTSLGTVLEGEDVLRSRGRSDEFDRLRRKSQMAAITHALAMLRALEEVHAEGP